MKKKTKKPKIDLRELEEKAQKADEYYDRMLRLQAEFENAKKRLARDQEEVIRFANLAVLSELITINDDLSSVINAAEKTHKLEDFLKGVELISANLNNLLKKYGLEKIKTLGERFDPARHEALMKKPHPEHPEDTVIEEVQAGYVLNGKVIKTAKVIISSKEAANNG